MLRNGLLSIFVGLALMAAACGGGSSNQDDAGVQDDGGGPQFDRIQSDQGGSQNDSTVGDNNDTFDQAITMDFTQTGYTKTGTMNPKGDVDYYKFAGTAGDWIAVFTDANPDCTETKLDPVVTLYNSSQTQVAENDDQVLGVNCDPFLITRLETTGDYYIKIQDWFTFYYPTDETKWQGGPLFTYKIYIAKLDDTLDGVTVDSEPGNDVATAQALEFPADSMGSLLGTFASTSDIDVYTFTLAVNSTVYVSFQGEGVDGNGSTSKAGQIYITDAAGTTTVALIDASQGALELQPPLLPAGNYALWVKAPAGTLGANAFYTATNFTGTTDNPAETEAATATGANDTLATAQTLPESSTAGSYYILANLPTADVDYFKVTLAANTTLAVACGAARNGSGVQGLNVSVRNSSDTEIRGASETLTEDLLIGGSDNLLTITTAGDYYVKLSKTGQAANVTGTWVRCGIHSRAAQ